jgi:hypothetical protein
MKEWELHSQWVNDLPESIETFKPPSNLVLLRSIPPNNKESSSRLKMTLPCASPDCGQVNRPFSNLLEQTQSPLPSQTRTFSRWRWPLQKQVPVHRLTRQTIADETVQPLEPLAHVGDPGGQIDPCGWTQSKHGLHPLQCTH